MTALLLGESIMKNTRFVTRAAIFAALYAVPVSYTHLTLPTKA